MRELLDDVLAYTSARADAAHAAWLGRLASERRLGHALVLALDLSPDARVPSKSEILAALTLTIAALDAIIDETLDAILHHPRFQALEASWRGLDWLTQRVEPGERLLVRVLNASWRDVSKDLERALDFDQSQLFKKLYTAEFDTPGGQPFGLVIGDFYVRHRPSEAGDDVATLEKLSEIAAAAFAPIVVGAHPSLFGVDSYSELGRPRDLERIFRGVEYTQWNALRDKPESRFLALALPRILLRAPWSDLAPRGISFHERASARDGSELLFGNAAFAFAAVVLRSMQDSRWPAGIRGVEPGVEGGGLVTRLASPGFATDAEGVAPRSPLEVAIGDRLEKELSDQGFLPLCACPGTSFAAFYGCASLQRPKRYDDEVARANAKLSASVQQMLCASRFAHYIKVIGRDRVGSFATPEDCERNLQDWLVDFASSNEDASAEIAARYPLREASAKVRAKPGQPGVWSCTLHLRPHYQLDQMSAAIKLETELYAGRVT